MSNLVKDSIVQFEQAISSFPDSVKNDGNFYTMFVELGKEPVTEPLTPKEKEYINELIKRNGGLRGFTAQACYGNAQLLMVSDYAGKLKYWEGYFCYEDLTSPIHHAWVTINNKVVDITLKKNQNRRNVLVNNRSKKNVKVHYFGIPIPNPLPMIRKQAVERKYWTSLTDMGSFSMKYWEKRKKNGRTKKG